MDEVRPLFDGNLIIMRKDGESEADAGWSFAGIASDETSDVEGDVLLKSCLDLTYAKKRGYVNWNHSRDPGDQVGYLTKCELIEGSRLEELEKTLGVPLQKTATIYVEGNLYRYSDKAIQVRNILKSAQAGYSGGLGISVDGLMAKTADGTVMKAFVRGVAMTPAPAHTNTLCHLRKALREQQDDMDGLTIEEALKWVEAKRPTWSKEFITRFVNYAAQRARRG